jgi:hypothetical protein
MEQQDASDQEKKTTDQWMQVWTWLILRKTAAESVQIPVNAYL